MTEQGCCELKFSLCCTCRKALTCPLQLKYREKCKLYERIIYPVLPLKQEVKVMESPELQATIAEISWKERLREEYAQLKERYEKLKAYNNKKEVEANLIGDRIMKQEDYYNNRLLVRQQEIMTDYLKVLELRAELAHIEL